MGTFEVHSAFMLALCWPPSGRSQLVGARWIFLVVAFLPSLGACAQSVTPALEGQPVGLIVQDRLIVPGERIGPLRLAGKIHEVVVLLGPATTTAPGLWPGSVVYIWEAISLWVVSDTGTGNVLWIQIGTGGSSPWSEHATADGIRLGMSEQDVISVIGAPERTLTSGGHKSLYYDRRGIRFTLSESDPLAGRVGALRIIWPSVPRGDTLIVPGKRISGVDVGAPIDGVVTVLGGGYLRSESQPGFYVYYWPHLELSLLARSDRVVTVRTAGPAEDAVPRYATKDGLGVGSSAGNIRKVYGHPVETTQATGGLWWIYPSRGIKFALDDQSRVQLVDVFPAQW